MDRHRADPRHSRDEGALVDERVARRAVANVFVARVHEGHRRRHARLEHQRSHGGEAGHGVERGAQPEPRRGVVDAHVGDRARRRRPPRPRTLEHHGARAPRLEARPQARAREAKRVRRRLVGGARRGGEHVGHPAQAAACVSLGVQREEGGGARRGEARRDGDADRRRELEAGARRGGPRRRRRGCDDRRSGRCDGRRGRRGRGWQRAAVERERDGERRGLRDALAVGLVGVEGPRSDEGARGVAVEDARVPAVVVALDGGLDGVGRRAREGVGALEQRDDARGHGGGVGAALGALAAHPRQARRGGLIGAGERGAEGDREGRDAREARHHRARTVRDRAARARGAKPGDQSVFRYSRRAARASAESASPQAWPRLL